MRAKGVPACFRLQGAWLWRQREAAQRACCERWVRGVLFKRSNLECEFDENLLQLFVDKIDAQLFERIELENFET